MSKPFTDVIESLIDRLGVLIPLSQSTESLLLASKSLHTLSKPIADSDDIEQEMRRRHLLTKTGTSENLDPAELQKLIFDTFTVIDSKVNDLSIQDLLLATKAVEGGSMAFFEWVMVNEPENADELMSQLHVRRNVTVNRFIDRLETLIPEIGDSEDAILVTNTISTMYGIQTSETEYEKLHRLLRDLKASIGARNGDLDNVLHDLDQRIKNADNRIKQNREDIDDLTDNLADLKLKHYTWEGRKDNPHSVSKAQVGLSRVDNFDSTSSLVDGAADKFSTAKAAKDLNIQKADKSTSISAGNGITGGGNLGADRTIRGVDATTATVGVTRLDSTLSDREDRAATPKIVKEVHSLALSGGTGLVNHKLEMDNPHNVTKHQVGLGNVQNYGATSSTSDPSPHKFSTAKAVKETMEVARSKLDADATAVNSGKLGGVEPNRFVYGKNTTCSNSATDFNALTKSGFYELNDGVGSANSPTPSASGGWWWVVSMSHTNNGKYGIQLVGENSQSSRYWLRARDASGNGNFAQLYTTHHKPSKSDVGLSNLQNWTATDSIGDGSTSKYLKAKAAKTLNDLKVNKTTKIIPGVGLAGGGVLSGHVTLNAITGNTSRVGVVQLSASITSNDQGKAAASSAIYTLNQNKVEKSTSVVAGHGLIGGGALGNNVTINARKASGSEAGVTTLSNSTSSTVSNAAATPKAVKDAKDAVTGSLNRHAALRSNPHGVTKAQVGLGYVYNWQATSSVTDSSTSKYATARGVKSAYDKGLEALNKAKTTESKLNGINFNNYLRTDQDDSFTGVLSRSVSGNGTHRVLNIGGSSSGVLRYGAQNSLCFHSDSSCMLFAGDSPGKVLTGLEYENTTSHDENAIIAADRDVVIYTGQQNGWEPTRKVLFTQAGGITAAGLVSCTDVSISSDRTVKRDISTIESPLDKINRMRGVFFTRIETGVREIGLVAQEVQKVIPEAVKVTDDEKGLLGVSYANLVGLLIEGVKGLADKFNRIEKELSPLFGSKARRLLTVSNYLTMEYREQSELGRVTRLSETEYLELLQWRESLRHVIRHGGDIPEAPVCVER